MHVWKDGPVWPPFIWGEAPDEGFRLGRYVFRHFDPDEWRFFVHRYGVPPHLFFPGVTRASAYTLFGEETSEPWLYGPLKPT